MLFATGKRPNRSAIKEFASTHRSVFIAHDPFDGVPVQLVAADGEPVGSDTKAQLGADEQVWIELLQDGLSFDLSGLSPGKSDAIPLIHHKFDIDQSPGALRLDALHLVPGQHLVGGARSGPVVRGLIALACKFIHHFDDLEAVVWDPIGSVIGKRFFESVTSAWLDGGAFPALGLTAFRETIDGALQSVGLDFWIGQELRIEPPLSNDKVEATRLGIRLINQLVIVGGLEASERIIAPDGSRLVMRPSRNGKFIRVSHE